MTESGLVKASLRTDQGRVRSNNEDFVAWREPQEEGEAERNGWLYILADGAGGMDAGEVASQFATERTLQHYLADGEERNWGRRLYKAMQAANTDLRELCASRKDNSRMATTMVATAIHDRRAHIANVGDSRAYIWRRGQLKQITKDQSLVAQLVDEGAITEEEAVNHPRRNVILYSLGSEKTPRIDLFTLELEPGDQLVVCSDGLTRHVSDEEIAMVLVDQPPDEATETLIKLANERGGQDNISVGVLVFEPAGTAARVVAGRRSSRQSVRAGQISGRGRAILWGYTLLLSLVQSALIFVIWLYLQSTQP